MNRDDSPLAQQIADALMAHAMATSSVDALEDSDDAPAWADGVRQPDTGPAEAPSRRRSGAAERLARLDAALADRLEAIGIDAETMAAAIARLATDLAALRARCQPA